MVSADLSILSALLAVYLDFLEFGLLRLGPLSPFIGAAGGLSYIDIEETHMQFPKTTTIVPGGQQTHSTWMLTAGFAVSLGLKMTLDLAWRYTDYGPVETDPATGRVIWHDESREPLELDLAQTSGHLRSHGLMVSLRYSF